MKIRWLAVLAATVAPVAPGAAVAQSVDMAEMQKWEKVNILHYEVVGEFRQKLVQIPPVDADLYADVVERVKLSFDWDRKKNALIGTPKIQNEPASVSNIVGIDKKCAKGKLNGPYEHFDVDTIKQSAPGEPLELIGRRVHPDTMVSESCGSKLRHFKGAVKPMKEYIGPVGPEMLIMAKMMPDGGPYKVTPDGKSIQTKAQNSNWVWTYTPTAK
jgi:hypothetical protein